MNPWIIILLIAVVIFFYNFIKSFIKSFIKARKASIQAAKRQKILEENAVRAEEINKRLKELRDNFYEEIGKKYPSRKKIDEIKAEQNNLEKERYKLTGQPTSVQRLAGVAASAEDNWKKKHGIPTKREIEAAKEAKKMQMLIQMQIEAEEARRKQQQPKIPWIWVGLFGSEIVKKFTDESQKRK